MEKLGPALFALGCLLGLVWLGFYRLERACLYAPRRDLDATPRSYGIPYEDVRFKAADGVELHGWFVPAPASGRAGRSLLFLHGNGGDISDRLDKLRIFHSLGLAVLLFDYRGYGLSRGRPDEQGTYRDALAAAKFLEERGARREGTAYYGESLGCAMALELALGRAPGALVLDSPFTSTVDMARRLFPRLPARWLVRNRYDNLSKIGRLKAPLLLIHSPEDDLVPFEMGRRLFEAAPEPKELLRSRGDHNGGFLETPDYAPRIRAFLERTLK